MNAVAIQSNVTSLFNRTQKKEPRPYIREATESDLAWDPELIEQFTVVDGENVRAGSSYAIVRPGMERWPLGHVKAYYKLTLHRTLLQNVIAMFAGFVTHTGSLLAGIGKHVAHQFEITHQAADKQVCGATVSSKLVITNGHTGADSVRAAMVVYIGRQPVGTILRCEAKHVGTQAVRWHSDVAAMIEASIMVQDALIDLLKASVARKITDEDRATLKARGINVRDKNANTLLDAIISWHRGGATTRAKGKLTWGVWERRLDDTSIRAMVVLLGRDTHGAALDAAFGFQRPRFAVIR